MTFSYPLCVVSDISEDNGLDETSSKDGAVPTPEGTVPPAHADLSSIQLRLFIFKPMSIVLFSILAFSMDF